MSSWFLGGALALALFGAVAVVAFESPTRSAGGLITAFLGVAAATGALGAPLVPGFILWVGVGAIGLLLLMSVLLLNLREDERARRPLRLRSLLAAPLLLALWSGLADGILDALGPSPGAGVPAAVHATDVGAAVAGPLAVPFAVALVALAVALVAAIALVRRRT